MPLYRNYCIVNDRSVITMEENSNFSENNLSDSHVKEFNKTTRSISDKGVKRKPKQLCKKCKKRYTEKGNLGSKQNTNIQTPDNISMDESNKGPDKNEEIQNILEDKRSFDINECATNISVWQDSEIKNTCEHMAKKRELSTLKDDDIKEVNVETSRIKLYDMSYCTLNEPGLPKNENIPIEEFWKQYNGHSSSSVNNKFVETYLENNNQNDEKTRTRSENKEDCNNPAISNNFETTFNTQKSSISKSKVNIRSKPAINKPMTASDNEKETTEDLKILEVNSKTKTDNELINFRDNLKVEKIPLNETTLNMSSKNDSSDVLRNIESVKEENVAQNSIQKVNIIETSRYIENPSTLIADDKNFLSERDQSVNQRTKNQVQKESVFEQKSDKTSEYEPGVGHGNVELMICNYSKEPRICINPKFVCDDINPNIIFNHSCFSIIPTSCDSISEYTTSNVPVNDIKEGFKMQTNKSNKKINDSINQIHKDSEITKPFKEDKDPLIQHEKIDAFQINPYEEYTNNGKKGSCRNEKAETMSEKRSNEKLILNETECIMNSDKNTSNLGILTSKNDVQNLKNENLKRIYEAKNSQNSISSSASIYLSKEPKQKVDLLNRTGNKPPEELEAKNLNLSNQYINLYEDSYIDVESCAALEMMEVSNVEKSFSRNDNQNLNLNLSKEKIFLTETKSSKNESELTENNININLDETNTNLEQETLPVRFGVNLPNTDMSKPLETIKNKYGQMSKSLLTLSEKLEEIEENIKKATASVEKITIYDTTNKIIKKSKQDLKVLTESCNKMDKLIDLISNESIIYGSHNVPEKESRFDKNNIIINEDIPLINNHINVNQKNKNIEVTNKDLYMNRNNGESNSTKEDIDKHSMKDYKTFENLVKELTLPLLENGDNENKTFKPEIPSRRIIIQEDVSSNKEKNILENQEIQLNKEIDELSKKREETIENNLNELNRLIGNKIQTTEKDTLKVPSIFLGPKNASRPPPKNTRFLLVGPNELIKPVTNDNLIRRPRTSMIDNGLKNLEVIDKKNIKPEKIADTPKGVIFEKKILIPEVKIKKKQIEKQPKDKNVGAFTKLSKSFTSLFSGDKKPSKGKNIVKSSPKGRKWTDHESYLELQKQKGKVKDMIEYYNNLDDKDSDIE